MLLFLFWIEPSAQSQLLHPERENPADHHQAINFDWFLKKQILSHSNGPSCAQKKDPDWFAKNCTKEKIEEALAKKELTFDQIGNNLGMRTSLVVLDGTREREIKLKKLSVPFDEMPSWKKDQVSDWKGKKVLSLGEGYSGYVAYLRSKGVDAQGLDIDYGKDGAQVTDEDYKGNELLIECSRQFLVLKDATDYVGKDFPPNTYDHIVGERLLCCLKESDDIDGKNRVLKTLVQTLQALKSGGTASFSFTHGFASKLLVPASPIHDGSTETRMRMEFGRLLTDLQGAMKDSGIQYRVSVRWSVKKKGEDPRGTLYFEKI